MNKRSSEQHEEIMEATYRALCEHGFASLTMQSIAAESEKSKGLLHYHFDSKDDLLVAFIEYLLDQFERDIASIEGTPAERLDAFIDRFVVERTGDDRHALHLALLELRAQAPYNDRYRHQLVESDELVREIVADIIRDGIDSGEFRKDIDPDEIARLILATMDGARTRGLTFGDEAYSTQVRETLYDQVITELTLE